MNSWGMSISLHVPSQDFGKTEGLCGTYDDNSNNDLKHQNSQTVANWNDDAELNDFVQSWR